MSHTALVQPATVRPLTAEQRQRLADAAWAEEDPQVIASYPGEFVVPHDRRIVAHGRDIQAVLKEAAAKTGRKLEELLVVGIDAPLQDMPH
jgi:hypothetical protein